MRRSSGTQQSRRRGSRPKEYTVSPETPPAAVAYSRAVFADTDPDAWWAQVTGVIGSAYEAALRAEPLDAPDPADCADSAAACAAAAVIVLAESQDLNPEGRVLRIGGGPW
jgi:hypothetical protein